MIDDTHDPYRRSFVEEANDGLCEFPLQNLPLGIFGTREFAEPRPGVAIGSRVFDLKRASELDLLPSSIRKEVFRAPSLNALFSLGRPALQELRFKLTDLLDERKSGNAVKQQKDQLLHPAGECRMHRPSQIANYTDFYSGIYHAITAGSLMRPNDPLPPNYKWVPIAYHGRASSVQVEGGEVRRPMGQLPPAADGHEPRFGACERLDFELEMGIYVRGGRPLGERIPIEEAQNEILGYCLLNDWSARDIQRWEMFPLGPFLSKSFATSVSPWVVTAEALAPFRVPAMTRAPDDPKPLAYLSDAKDQASGGIDVELDVTLSTSLMRRAGQSAVPILRTNAKHLYWTPAQMIAHHTVNGCNLEPGDLIGTGTISGPNTGELGSMLELTAGGSNPLNLGNGEQRAFLNDGDRVAFSGRCRRSGCVSIGFGRCVGTLAEAGGTSSR